MVDKEGCNYLARAVIGDGSIKQVLWRVVSVLLFLMCGELARGDDAYLRQYSLGPYRTPGPTPTQPTPEYTVVTAEVIYPTATATLSPTATSAPTSSPIATATPDWRREAAPGITYITTLPTIGSTAILYNIEGDFDTIIIFTNVQDQEPYFLSTELQPWKDIEIMVGGRIIEIDGQNSHYPTTYWLDGIAVDITLNKDDWHPTLAIKYPNTGYFKR